MVLHGSIAWQEGGVRYLRMVLHGSIAWQEGGVRYLRMVLHGSIAVAGRRGEVLEDGVAWQYSLGRKEG